MADRFPLILNTSANQIQEIASGDSLDLTGTNIANAGIITAGNVIIGAATTDLIVNGDARITGILTIGTSSLKLDGPNNLVNVGTALTLGHSQGVQFHTQNLHSAGFEVNQINVSGIITSTGAVVNGDIDANGDLDVDGHTNLDNVSIVGVTTTTDHIDIDADNKRLRLGASQDLQIYHRDTSFGSFVENFTGNLHISNSSSNTSGEIKIQAKSGEKSIYCLPDAAVELYYDATKRIETISTGGNVVGKLGVNNNSPVGELDIANKIRFYSAAAASTPGSNGNPTRFIEIVGSNLGGATEIGALKFTNVDSTSYQAASIACFNEGGSDITDKSLKT